MRDVLPNRSRPARTYAAVVLFVLVYVGVLAVVFAPKDVIPIETGAIFATN